MGQSCIDTGGLIQHRNQHMVTNSVVVMVLTASTDVQTVARIQHHGEYLTGQHEIDVNVGGCDQVLHTQVVSHFLIK